MGIWTIILVSDIIFLSAADSVACTASPERCETVFSTDARIFPIVSRKVLFCRDNEEDCMSWVLEAWARLKRPNCDTIRCVLTLRSRSRFSNCCNTFPIHWMLFGDLQHLQQYPTWQELGGRRSLFFMGCLSWWHHNRTCSTAWSFLKIAKRKWKWKLKERCKEWLEN